MQTIQCFNEWITLADAHTLLGTTPDAGGPEDIRVQGMIDSIDAMIVAYLNRNLKHCEHSETFLRPTGSFINLKNWPLVSITSITTDGTVTSETDFEIDEDLSILHWTSDGLTWTGVQPKTVVIQYESGLDPMPYELVTMFNTLLQDREDAGGSASTGGVGDIKKVSLTGVAAVEFDTGGSSVSYSGVDRSTGVPEELKPYVGLLDKYRGDEVMGVI